MAVKICVSGSATVVAAIIFHLDRMSVSNAEEYELGIPRGREVWIVGAFSSGPEELGQILQWTPSRIHMFEPVVECLA